MGIIGGKFQGPTQVDPSLCTEITEKTGYLCKKPENTLLLRRQWPKRYCTVSMQGFTLANSHVSECREWSDTKSSTLSMPAESQPSSQDSRHSLSVQGLP